MTRQLSHSAFAAIHSKLMRLGVLPAAAVLAFGGAKDPKQVWATRLAPLVKEPPGWTAVERHETRGLAFSPDRKLIAVTLMHDQRVSGLVLFDTHLLLLSANTPETIVRQFDLSRNCGVDLTWNEKGDALLVCGAIVMLSDGAGCIASSPPSWLPPLSWRSGPGLAFWLDSEHLVRSNGEILDLTCKQSGTWNVEPAWQIGGLAALKGWVQLWHRQGTLENTSYQHSLVDLASHRTLAGWATRKMESVGGSGGMAVGAGAFCFSVDEKLQCREIAGGMKMPLPKQLRDYRFGTASTSSSRIVVEKWDDHDPFWERALWWWVPVPGFPPLPKRRVVVDLRSGAVIASWKPRIQGSRSPDVRDWPYHVALSPAGDLLAESGEGVVELYRLAP